MKFPGRVLACAAPWRLGPGIAASPDRGEGEFPAREGRPHPRPPQRRTQAKAADARIFAM